jgi:hypothetical protein
MGIAWGRHPGHWCQGKVCPRLPGRVFAGLCAVDVRLSLRRSAWRGGRDTPPTPGSHPPQAPAPPATDGDRPSRPKAAPGVGRVPRRLAHSGHSARPTTATARRGVSPRRGDPPQGGQAAPPCGPQDGLVKPPPPPRPLAAVARRHPLGRQDVGQGAMPRRPPPPRAQPHPMAARVGTRRPERQARRANVRAGGQRRHAVVSGLRPPPRANALLRVRQRLKARARDPAPARYRRQPLRSAALVGGRGGGGVPGGLGAARARVDPGQPLAPQGGGGRLPPGVQRAAPGVQWRPLGPPHRAAARPPAPACAASPP